MLYLFGSPACGVGQRLQFELAQEMEERLFRYPFDNNSSKRMAHEEDRSFRSTFQLSKTWSVKSTE